MVAAVATNPSAEKKTFRLDLWRGGLNGVIETAYGGFALVVVIGFFDAQDWVKGLVAASFAFGLLFTPLTLSWFARLGFKAGYIASSVSLAAAVLLLVGSFSASLWGFLIPTSVSFAMVAQFMPLLVHIWAENYPANKRGAYLSLSMMATVATALCYSLLGGWLMDQNVDNYRWVMAGVGLACALMALVLAQIPSSPVSRGDSENPFKNLSYAFSDKLFGGILLSWMFLGFGNLMVLPLRVEYLLQPEYGIEADKSTVMLAMIGIPALFRFLSSRLWGYLFDVVNFMKLRMALNAMIMASILLFFTTRNIWLIYASSAVLGMAMAGATISWSLWVTKFASPERAPAYMSVHTFTTGVRGVLAPFVGFYLIAVLGSTGTAFVGASLVAISIPIIGAVYLFSKRLST